MRAMRAGVVGVILIACAVWGALPVAALSFGPLVQEFSGSGRSAKRVFRIENNGETPIAVQIQMKHREVATNGDETLTDAEDEFVVFPPQMVLRPGEKRLIRVQWLGDPTPKQQLTYRIIAEQLPVSFEEKKTEGSRLQLLVRYEGSIYISPAGAKSRLAVTGVPRTSPEGEPLLFLVFANTGTAYQVMSGLQLTLRSKVDDSSIALTSDRLKGISGENVLAGRERHFTIPWPSGLTMGPLEVSPEIGLPR